MRDRFEAGGVFLAGKRIQPLIRRDAERLRQLLVSIEQVIESGVGDLGRARAIGLLMVADLRSELLELIPQRLLVSHTRC